MRFASSIFTHRETLSHGPYIHKYKRIIIYVCIFFFSLPSSSSPLLTRIDYAGSLRNTHWCSSALWRCQRPTRPHTWTVTDRTEQLLVFRAGIVITIIIVTIFVINSVLERLSPVCGCLCLFAPADGAQCAQPPIIRLHCAVNGN